MKTLFLSALLAVAPAAFVRAAEPAPAPAPFSDRDGQELAEQLRAASAQIDDLRQRLETVEKRLGDSYGAVSPFDTVERRLDDLEREVKDLNRR